MITDVNGICVFPPEFANANKQVSIFSAISGTPNMKLA
jgi:hypothetical protein